MAKRDGQHTIGEVLKTYIASGKLQKGLDKVSVKESWARVMGEAIGKYTTDVQLDGQTLYVQLSSSVLREELSYGKEKILRLLNEDLDKSLIKKLVLR
jgi:hypothetical protein